MMDGWRLRIMGPRSATTAMGYHDQQGVEVLLNDNLKLRIHQGVFLHNILTASLVE